MRTGQGQTAKLAVLMASVLAAATSNLNRVSRGKDEPLPTADYRTVSRGGRKSRRQFQVPNNTKRGVRRAQTRGRR